MRPINFYLLWCNGNWAIIQKYTVGEGSNKEKDWLSKIKYRNKKIQHRKRKDEN